MGSVSTNSVILREEVRHTHRVSVLVTRMLHRYTSNTTDTTLLWFGTHPPSESQWGESRCRYRGADSASYSEPSSGCCRNRTWSVWEVEDAYIHIYGPGSGPEGFCEPGWLPSHRRRYLQRLDWLSTAWACLLRMSAPPWHETFVQILHGLPEDSVVHQLIKLLVEVAGSPLHPDLGFHPWGMLEL